jgi:hypothetical protein
MSYALDQFAVERHRILATDFGFERRKTGRKSFFGSFVEALHDSRRCQALREMRRYQHLLHEAQGRRHAAEGR